MRELVYYIAASIDGFIAGPNGEADAFTYEGDHMAPLNERFPDAIPTDIAAHFGIPQSGATFGTVLMGSNTYSMGLKDGRTSPYSHLEQIVFSQSLPAEEGYPTITAADPVSVVSDIKKGDGADIWLCGGGSLAASLNAEIDRIVIKRNPVLFGEGVPLFERSDYSALDFEVVANTAYDSGVIVTEYIRKR